MMRRTLIAASFLLATFAPARAEAPPAHGSPAAAPSVVPAIDADAALAMLKDGNARFVSSESTFPHLDQDRRCFTTEGGQHPIASILSCADSRVPPELLFDTGIGDLFVVRVAGNVADTDEIGTLEYGAGHLNIPLIVVMGHTKCGAVTAVVKNAEVGGSIPKLVDNIAPAVADARAKYAGVPEAKLIQYATRANVFQSVKDILTRSEEIRELVSEGKVQVVGAVYDIHNGTIEWLGEHPQQTALLGAPAHEPAEANAEEHAEDAHATAEGATDAHAARDQQAEEHAAKDESKGETKGETNDEHATAKQDDADAHAKPASAKQAASHEPAEPKKSTSHSSKEAEPAKHGATPHGDAAKDEHGAAKGEGEHAAKGEEGHTDAAAIERESLVKKHGLLVPGVFLAAGSVLSGTIVFVLKHKTTPTAAAPDTHAPTEAKPAAH